VPSPPPPAPKASQAREAAPRPAEGTPADRDADAAALEATPSHHPGSPLLSHGLEIRTVRPDFVGYSLTTVLTASPRNPVVQMSFDRRGVVREASFFKQTVQAAEFGRPARFMVHSTGFDLVDAPLLNSVYQWTARGRALDELPENDPEARVTILVRVILR
jgi:hypothetical protein